MKSFSQLLTAAAFGALVGNAFGAFVEGCAAQEQWVQALSLLACGLFSGALGIGAGALYLMRQPYATPERKRETVGNSTTPEREEKLAKTADDLHGAIFTMLRDWRDGDFKLPPLAKIHMDALEAKALELGTVLFRSQNVKVMATPLAGASLETGGEA